VKLLFIPHVPNLGVVNRVYEFARYTGGYFLSWQIDNSTFARKVVSQLRSLRPHQDGRTVQIPLLFKPERAAAGFNTSMLNRLVERLRVDAVVNANALLFDVGRIEAPVVYDLVDDHLAVNPGIGLTEKRVAKIREDLRRSRGVVCVSEPLRAKVLPLNPRAVTIENGVSPERFERAESLKKPLGLAGKKVFGYIGGVEPWTGLEAACESFMRIRDPGNAMIVVGGSRAAYYRNLKKRFGNEILFAGPVAPEKVADWFKTLDVGLIPFERNDFTDNALPIKALEYALAGASVLSTPLAYLRRKGYPFVRFCEISEFAECMAAQPPAWHYDFTSCGWEKRAGELLSFVKGSL